MMHVEIDTWKYKTYRYSVKTYADPERKMFGMNICTSDGYESEEEAYKAAIAWLNEEHCDYYTLMNPRQYESKFGKVEAEVDLQVWKGDYAMTFDEIRFDCSLALDEFSLEFVKTLYEGESDYDTDYVFAKAVSLGMVNDHAGPFDCYILDQDELDEYIAKREKEEAC